jgi:hypothetical protein
VTRRGEAEQRIDRTIGVCQALLDQGVTGIACSRVIELLGGQVTQAPLTAKDFIDEPGVDPLTGCKPVSAPGAPG